VLGLADAVIELAVTPDRATASRCAAWPRAGLRADNRVPRPGQGWTCRRRTAEAWPVRIEDPVVAAASSRASDRGGSAGTEPWWIARRLLAAGVGPISLAVDVTNYVMMELGSRLARLRHVTLDPGPSWCAGPAERGGGES